MTKKSKFDLDGILGLKIYENNNKVYGHGLISQLKSKKIINNETFFFDFDKNNINIGELVIGEYPHLIDKYKENYPYYQFKSAGLHIQTYDIKFEIKVISSFWYGIKFENDVKIEIDIESGYIIGSKYFEEAADKFFTPYFRNKKCRRDTVNVLYYAYICDDDIDISSFPEIKFYTGDADYNFTLTYEDVFVKKFGKTYFMIVFDTKGYNVFWTLGSTFIKRNLRVLLRLHIDARNIIPFRICRFYIYGSGSGGDQPRHRVRRCLSACFPDQCGRDGPGAERRNSLHRNAPDQGG